MEVCFFENRSTLVRQTRALEPELGLNWEQDRLAETLDSFIQMSLYLLRFDDICPSMNWQIWDSIEPILDKYNIRPIVAVVPLNRDPQLVIQDSGDQDFWEKVRKWQDKQWIIAVHGYTHIYDSPSSGLMRLNPFSEFAGHSYEVQLARMTKATELFHNNEIHPRVFVAPAHSFDDITLRVLSELGIKMISDGFSFRTSLDNHEVCWIPQQLWNLRRMPFGLWTFCCHPNSMMEKQLQKLSSFLAKNKDKFIFDLDMLCGRAQPMNCLDHLSSSIIRCVHGSHEIVCKALLFARSLKQKGRLQ